jgi:hypothetical protein
MAAFASRIDFAEDPFTVSLNITIARRDIEHG